MDKVLKNYHNKYWRGWEGTTCLIYLKWCNYYGKQFVSKTLNGSAYLKEMTLRTTVSDRQFKDFHLVRPPSDPYLFIKVCFISRCDWVRFFSILSGYVCTFIYICVCMLLGMHACVQLCVKTNVHYKVSSLRTKDGKNITMRTCIPEIFIHILVRFDFSRM